MLLLEEYGEEAKRVEMARSAEEADPKVVLGSANKQFRAFQRSHQKETIRSSRSRRSKGKDLSRQSADSQSSSISSSSGSESDDEDQVTVAQLQPPSKNTSEGLKWWLRTLPQKLSYGESETRYEVGS